MAVERSIVQHHVLAPAHAVEDFAPACDGADGESRAKRFSESAEVRLQVEILLASARRVAKPRNHLIENEERSVAMGEIAQLLKIGIARQNAAHIRHDRLG